MIVRCRPDWEYGGGIVTLIEMVDGASYVTHETPEKILGKELT